VSIKFAVLGLLGRKELHGYAIKQRIERDFGHLWTANYGQIYPALRALEAEGLVTMVEQAQPRSPTRKLYSITPRGRTALRRWLNGPTAKRPVLRDPFLLRFTFFSQGDADAALRAIDEQVAMYKAQLRGRREALIGWRRKDLYVRLASELGIELNAMMLAWLARARAEVAAAEGSADADAAPPVRRARGGRR
jgi:DNA-binding PadR family transcriptional regulator